MYMSMEPTVIGTNFSNTKMDILQINKEKLLKSKVAKMLKDKVFTVVPETISLTKDGGLFTLIP
jgi:hypothetical protein